MSDQAHYTTYGSPDEPFEERVEHAKHGRVVASTTYVSSYEQTVADPKNHRILKCDGCGTEWTVVLGHPSHAPCGVCGGVDFS